MSFLIKNSVYFFIAALCFSFPFGSFAENIIVTEQVQSNIIPLVLETKEGKQIHIFLPREELILLKGSKAGDKLKILSPIPITEEMNP